MTHSSLQLHISTLLGFLFNQFASNHDPVSKIEAVSWAAKLGEVIFRPWTLWFFSRVTANWPDVMPLGIWTRRIPFHMTGPAPSPVWLLLPVRVLKEWAMGCDRRGRAGLRRGGRDGMGNVPMTCRSHSFSSSRSRKNKNPRTVHGGC